MTSPGCVGVVDEEAIGKSGVEWSRTSVNKVFLE